ncbi:abasic site processing protein HMCES-like, partial [Stegodyphus dumicola]|uniref:abasic site processing protein HMCES-like n=1 Tax=Stegodyphus dumicola TaxID=202533 RepID=UPI0015AF2749
MCGRIACTLDKDCIQRATCRYSKNKESLNWIEKYNWQSYQPNYNLSPSQISPVLVADYLISAQDNSDYNHVITPMRWGFIPSWYKGSYEEFSLKTNNCRIEGILEKPTYRGSAVAGRRCVILADGFYEWKVVSNKQKKPYFIYFPQEDGPDVFCRENDSSSESKEWKGPHLLTMAGLFDIWRTSE